MKYWDMFRKLLAQAWKTDTHGRRSKLDLLVNCGGQGPGLTQNKRGKRTRTIGNQQKQKHW